MTIKELTQLTPDQRYEYFCEHAKYHKENPDNAKYSIRIGATNKIFFAGDTHELHQKLIYFCEHAAQEAN